MKERTDFDLENIRATGVIVEELQPGIEYEFYITAVTEEGLKSRRTESIFQFTGNYRIQ